MLLAVFLAGLVLQTAQPGQRIVVCLENGQQLVLQNPEFNGFIEGKNGDALLIYRQSKYHGQIPLKNIARIEFHPYTRGPFSMKITLADGQTLEVESEGPQFVSVRGRTDFGLVTIKQPDPISAPVKLTTKKPSRKNDLTIQYLEIPSS
jgi:hypothetical protein